MKFSIDDKGSSDRSCGNGEFNELAKKKTSEMRSSCERAMGFEPTTSSLARKHSTTELHPQGKEQYSDIFEAMQGSFLYFTLQDDMCKMLNCS
jgi:hypothetical protein